MFALCMQKGDVRKKGVLQILDRFIGFFCFVQFTMCFNHDANTHTQTHEHA